jgi:hypothetical protein
VLRITSEVTFDNHPIKGSAASDSSLTCDVSRFHAVVRWTTIVAATRVVCRRVFQLTAVVFACADCRCSPTLR